ncbi:MAG TPA: hypothetical protein PKJ75_02685 [Methanosarcina vacuolata]|nr:hypothetical protein [Methanosarcina vacuolata]HPS88952.1 hypothetical protein [Methanosarcina vacuolata]
MGGPPIAVGELGPKFKDSGKSAPTSSESNHIVIAREIQFDA